MEDDFDIEVIRLKKLLEDRLMQADKENMTILQSSSKVHGNAPHPVKQNSRSLPTVKQTARSSPPVKHTAGSSPPVKHTAGSSLPVKQNFHRFSPPVRQNVSFSPSAKQNVVPSSLGVQIGTDVDVTDTHSRIHFLKDMESSLLSKYSSRRILLTDSRNKYTPCAVPLSPPIRLKKDTEEKTYSPSNSQSEVPMHICDKPSHAVAKASLVHTCGKSKYANSTSTLEHSCNKSLKSNITLIEKNFPSTPVNNVIHSAATISERELKPQVKNAYQNTSFVYNDSFQHPKDNFHSDRKMNDSPIERKIPELKPEATSFTKDLQNSQPALDKGKDENRGFHLKISLDSCSTKDVINNILSKIPEMANKFAASCDLNDVTCSASVQRAEKGQSSLISPDYSNNSPVQSKLNQQKHIVSTCTQTMLNSFNLENSGFSKKDNQTVSSSTQTVQNKELPVNELKYLVREIVLDTLQTPEIIERLHTVKGLSIPQKVDSGIQSEIESDVPEQGKMIGNKDVQVNLDSCQLVQVKYLQDRSSNTENFQMPVKLMTSSNREYVFDNSDTAVSERNASPILNSNNKMEEMLEKIYEHICQEKEVPKDSDDITLRHSILTRDVAVQFNPLHTTTKGTLTSPIKQVDSSSQYDVKLKVDAEQKLENASAQLENFVKSSNQPLLLVDSCTQCENKVFSSSTTQTEIVGNLEHSAASVSSTPGSDSMYMDDLLSEGEAFLPLNLRLLPHAGENMNVSHADSTDTSIKDKDYSLSEGEIHPNIIRYLNMQHSNFLEDNDTFDVMYTAKQPETDSILHTPLSDKAKLGQSTGRNLRLDICNSSISEGEYNTSPSLSLGEVSPGFRISFLDASQKADSYMATGRSFSNDKLVCDNLSSSQASSVSQHSSRSEGELSRNMLQIHARNSSQSALQTVNEEVHSMFD